jgi:hypothetical protein
VTRTRDQLAWTGLFMLWATTAAWMVLDYRADPPDPTRSGPQTYGHNHDGALTIGLVMTVAELGLVIALLRPWSYERSWGRSLAMVMVLLPWLVFSTLMAIHAGGVLGIHLAWVAALLLIALVATIWSGIAAKRAASANNVNP